MIWISLVLLFVVLIRLPFLIGTSSDRHTHLWLCSVYKNAKGKQLEKNLRSPEPGMLVYPTALEFLVSYLPSSAHQISLSAVVVASDALQTLLIFSAGLLIGIPNQVALGFSVVWATLPILFPKNARIVGLGARTLGSLLATSTLMVMMAALTSGPFKLGLWVLTAALCGAVVLTSQFAWQYLTLSAIGLSLAGWSPYPSFIVALPWFWAAIRRDGEIARVIKGKLRHFRWYYTTGYEFLSNKNSFSGLRSAAEVGPVKLVAHLLGNSSLIVVLLGLAGVYPFLWLLYEAAPADVELELFRRLAFGILGASCIAALLSAFGRLRIFGESERYVEYSTPFLIIMLMTSGLKFDSISIFVLATTFNLSLVAVTLTMTLFAKRYSRTERLGEVNVQSAAQFLASHAPLRVLTSPITLSSRFMLEDRSMNTYFNFLVSESGDTTRWWPKRPACYPFPSLIPAALGGDLNFDAVVVDSAALNSLTGPMSPEMLTSNAPSYSNDGFQIFLLNDNEK